MNTLQFTNLMAWWHHKCITSQSCNVICRLQFVMTLTVADGLMQRVRLK